MNVESKQFEIEEAFSITNRGVAVVLNKNTTLDVGREYFAELTAPDGTLLKVTAFKEWLLRRSLIPPEREAFILVGTEKDKIFKGSTITFYG